MADEKDPVSNKAAVPPRITASTEVDPAVLKGLNTPKPANPALGAELGKIDPGGLRPVPPRFATAADGTPASPDLDLVGPGPADAFLPVTEVRVLGHSIVPIGGDYWSQNPYPLGTAYSLNEGTWFAGPFVVSEPVITVRAAVDPGTIVTFDVWVLSPATLTPPWQAPPAPAPKPGYQGPGVPTQVSSNPATTAPTGVQLPTPAPTVTYADYYGRDVDLTNGPYCREIAAWAVLNTCAPWLQCSVDVSALNGAQAYIGITVAGPGNAHVNYLRQVETAPVGLDPAVPAPPVWGFADLHSHPMAHIGFGGHFIAGQYAPTSDDPADIERCDVADHFRGNTDLLVNDFPDGHQAGDAQGPPQFHTWPSSLDGIHQQMHPAWIRRAFDGGLRLMVALVVNNALMGDLHGLGVPAVDVADDASITAQLDFFDQVIAHNSSWMALVETPQQARTAIAAGKLAVVYGIEVDSFLGSWMTSAAVTTDGADAAQVVRDRLETLYARGVRQLNPVHLANNAFGGCSVYEDLFNLNNFFLHGEWLSVEQADSDIDFRLGEPGGGFLHSLMSIWPGAGPLVAPDYDHVAAGHGHQNTEGASDIAAAALDQMMALGMVIDVDHMSNKTTQAVLDQCTSAADAASGRSAYPVVSAHSTFRAVARRKNWADPDKPGVDQRQDGSMWPHESSKSDATASAILDVGGMLAPITGRHDTLPDPLATDGWAMAHPIAGSSTSWANELHHAHILSQPHDRGVGIGTDMALLAQIGPRFGPLAAYGLAGEHSEQGPYNKRTQAFEQGNGVIYRTPVSGSSRFFNPPDVDAGGKLNPYLEPQDAPLDLKIGNEYAFANDVWKALWHWEAQSGPDGTDNDDVKAMTQGFQTPPDAAGRLDGLARTAFQALHDLPLSDPGDPNDQRRQQAMVLTGVRFWRSMRTGSNVALSRCTAGDYTFDINVDGLAHYGLLPDLLQDLSNVGAGAELLGSLFRSAESYLAVWEIAEAHAAIRTHVGGTVGRFPVGHLPIGP